MSVQVSYKKQTLLGIIFIFLILLVVEIVANIWWSTQINCEFEQNEIFKNSENIDKRQLCLDFYNVKTSGDELIPNQKFDSISINTLGFRGSEFSDIKPPNTYRIFMIGGSTMFGAGSTSDMTTIPGFIQEFFNEDNLTFDIEVINSGIQAADSNTELNLVKQKLINFSPDLIIVYDGWNDLRANISPDKLKTNWESICEFGNKNNFDTVLSLQPIAGFGGKLLTEQESVYAKTGENYSKTPLIESLSIYDDYAKNLSKIETCTKAIDLRDVFNNETDAIYWDQGHISDQGNLIVANSLYDVIIPIISKNDNLNTIESNIAFNSIKEKIYEDREITVNVELIPSNLSQNQKLNISTYDNTNKKFVEHVTYFLSISKNNENLLREYFYSQNENLSIEIQSNNEKMIKVVGEKQYAHNAYVTLGSEYRSDVSSNTLISETPLQLIGSILTDGNYVFDIELRTLDNPSNWVYTLHGFHHEINLEKDITNTQNSKINSSSIKFETYIRDIFSNYKTPILLNKILNP